MRTLSGVVKTLALMLLCASAVGLAAIPVVASPDSLINLVQWPASEGGNGHWYGIIPTAQYWRDAVTTAAGMTYNGLPGYLATVTSPEENAFIFEQVIVGLIPPTILPQYWLGGRDVGINQWQWLNGEAWDYTNWASGEPNNEGIETALCLRGYGMDGAGMWNNALPDDSIHTLHQWWSIVEFSADAPPPPPDTLINLVQWPAASGGNDHWYAIVPIVQPWVFHRELAGTFVHDGDTGYLATVTTPAENEFVKSVIEDHTNQPSITDQFYLGGYKNPSTGWGWLTKEAWDWTNWSSGEPSGDGPALGLWGASKINFGFWNDVPQDTVGIGHEHQLWALIEFGSYDTVVTLPPPPDTLINLVQWPKSAGGNDHWYAVMPRAQYWRDAVVMAGLQAHQGLSGYLATPTSEEENVFIRDHVIVGLTPQTILPQFWLGGKDIAVDQWQWLTGEDWEYSNWYSFEPNNNGIETALCMRGYGMASPGTWNNALPDDSVHTLHQWWSVVEFGAVQIVADSLIFPSAAGAACTGCGSSAAIQPVACYLEAPALGATISFEIPPEVTVCEIRFDGYLTEAWDFTFVDINSDSGFVVVNLANSTGQVIPAGLSVLFDVQFAATASGHTEDFVIRWDTALSTDPGRQTKFVNEQFETFAPKFDYLRDSTMITINSTAGDITDDSEADIADLTALIDFIFRGGPQPCNISSADVNGDCHGPDIGDITYYIAYLFRGGQALREGCINSKKEAAVSPTDLTVRTSFDGSATTIEIDSPVDLFGLQVELTDLAPAEPSLLIEGGFDVVFGRDGTVSHIGVMDLEGEAVIAQGRTVVLRVPGEHGVRSAVASDVQHRVHTALLATGPALPTEYALHPNYPNPFNPTTVIAFDLPGSAQTRLEVFNVAGQRVALLVDRVLPQGNHEITWNAGDLASGVYVTRLTAGDFSATRKMLLLK